MKAIRHMMLAALPALVLVVLAPGGNRAHADGIGIFPTSLTFEGALRGGEYFQDVGIIHDFPLARTYTFVAEGPVAPWVSFADSQTRTRIDTISVPARSKPLFLIRIDLPRDAANGVYQGTIRVISNDADAGNDDSSGSGVNIGVEIPISVEVTGTQEAAGTLVNVSAKDTEIGTPLRLEATVNNQGNVSIDPELQVKIIETTGVVVGEANLKGQGVPPAESKVLVVEWDTARQAAGDYRAVVAGKWQDLDLGSKEITFRLVPYGALSRQGELGNIAIEGQLRPQETVRMTAMFRNTGQVDSQAELAGELYEKDRLVQAISGRARFVKVGSEEELEAFFAVPETGAYTLRVKAHFEGNETAVQELSFSVAPEGDGGLKGSLAVPLAGGFLAIVATALSARFVLRRRTPGPQQ